MPPESVSELYGRSKGRCEHPDGCQQYAQVIHHRKGRGFPGCHDLIWLLHLCPPCHDKTHANPDASYGNGAMVRRNGPVAPHVRDAG